MTKALLYLITIYGYVTQMDKVLEKTKARLREAFPEMSEQEVEELATHMRDLARLAIDSYLDGQKGDGKSGK